MLFPGTRPPRPEPPLQHLRAAKPQILHNAAPLFPSGSTALNGSEPVPVPRLHPSLPPGPGKPGPDGRNPAQPLMVVRPPGNFSAPRGKPPSAAGHGGRPPVGRPSRDPDPDHGPPPAPREAGLCPLHPHHKGYRTGRAPRKGPNLHPCNTSGRPDPIRQGRLCAAPRAARA
jgi:hypothetical protein